MDDSHDDPATSASARRRRGAATGTDPADPSWFDQELAPVDAPTPVTGLPGRDGADAGALRYHAPRGYAAGQPGGGVPGAAPGDSAGGSPFEGIDGGSAASDEDLDLFEPSWTPTRRFGRVTAVLAAGIVAALAFTGGVLVQKRHDQGLAGSGGGAAAAFNRLRSSGGLGGGGFSFGGGTAGATGGTGAGTGSPGVGSGTGAAAGTPVVVGTVVSISGSTLKVKNFAGTVVTVTVPATASVTTTGLTPLKAGMTVSVSGTKAADGSVTAGAVVSRSAR
jgi:hypothetical protein